MLLLFLCCFTAMFGIILGLSAVFINDGSAVRSKGFFQGYNKYVWTVIFLQVEINFFCVAHIINYLWPFFTSNGWYMTFTVPWRRIFYCMR